LIFILAVFLYGMWSYLTTEKFKFFEVHQKII